MKYYLFSPEIRITKQVSGEVFNLLALQEGKKYKKKHYGRDFSLSLSKNHW
jgi:hypothetical protein